MSGNPRKAPRPHTISRARVASRGRPWLAFTTAAPIALLGGLMGLGGAECRLPLLTGPFGYSVRQAVPLNLAVSLTTVAIALAVRTRSLAVSRVEAALPVLLALMIGGTIAAVAGPRLLRRLNDTRLESAIATVLLAVGLVLIGVAFLPDGRAGLLPPMAAVEVMSGVLFGLAIGLASSLLGVAGGALLIPTLIFAYGLDIKSAGTVSLVACFPAVVTGVVHYARRGTYCRQGLWMTVIPMGAGSILGATCGGLLAGTVPAEIVTVALGVVLIGSAYSRVRSTELLLPQNPRLLVSAATSVARSRTV